MFPLQHHWSLVTRQWRSPNIPSGRKPSQTIYYCDHTIITCSCLTRPEAIGHSANTTLIDLRSYIALSLLHTLQPIKKVQYRSRQVCFVLPSNAFDKCKVEVSWKFALRDTVCIATKLFLDWLLSGEWTWFLGMRRMPVKAHHISQESFTMRNES